MLIFLTLPDFLGVLGAFERLEKMYIFYPVTNHQDFFFLQIKFGVFLQIDAENASIGKLLVLFFSWLFGCCYVLKKLQCPMRFSNFMVGAWRHANLLPVLWTLLCTLLPLSNTRDSRDTVVYQWNVTSTMAPRQIINEGIVPNPMQAWGEEQVLQVNKIRMRTEIFFPKHDRSY